MEYDSKGRIYRKYSGSGEAAPGQGTVRQYTDFFYDIMGALQKVSTRQGLKGITVILTDTTGKENLGSSNQQNNRGGRQATCRSSPKRPPTPEEGEVATIKKGVEGIPENEWIHSATEYDAFGRSIRVFSQNPGVKEQVDLIRQIRYLKPPEDTHTLGTFAI